MRNVSYALTFAELTKLAQALRYKWKTLVLSVCFCGERKTKSAARRRWAVAYVDRRRKSVTEDEVWKSKTCGADESKPAVPLTKLQGQRVQVNYRR